MTLIAGPYYGTWNGTYIGRSLDGFHQSETIHSTDVKTDDFGGMDGALADAIVKGASTIVTLDFAEYDLIATVSAALWGAKGGAGLAGYANGRIGALASTLAKPLVLTKIPGFGAFNTATPNTRTFLLALVMGNLDIPINAGLRRGPVRFVCFPNTSVTYSTGQGGVTFDANYGQVWKDT